MRLPGFRYNGKTLTAHIEYCLPGTRGGRRKRKILRGVTRDEALQEWKKLRHPTPDPAPDTKPWTFGGYVEAYWSAIAARVKASTSKNEGYQLRKWLLPRFGPLPLERINAAELRDLVTHLKGAGLSPWSVNAIAGLLVRILRDAVERDALAVLPVRGRIRKQRTEILRLEMTPEEQDAFLCTFNDRPLFGRWLSSKRQVGVVRISEHFSEPRRFGGGLREDSPAADYYFERFHASGPVFILALETGLRRGDLLALSWRDVDLENAWIRTVTQKRKEPAVVAISARCREALEELRRRPRAIHGTVCVDLEGEAYKVATILRHFEVAKALAGITRRLRFHDLRHTFASDLVSLGVPEPWIRKAMGQRDDRSLRRYAKARDEALRAVAEALDRKAKKS